MKSDEGKAAVGAYKERKTIAGIYAVRCTTSGEVWVGQTPNVDKAQNRIWFTLGLGNNPCRSLQKAWADHGAESFTFEVLERMEDEESAYARNTRLKERMLHWRLVLGGLAI